MPPQKNFSMIDLPSMNPEQEEEILHEVEEELQMKLNGQGEILEPSKEGEPGILNGNTG